MSATVAALEVVLQHEHDPAMDELRRELAAARQANIDLDDRNQWIQARHDVYIEEYIEDIAELQQRLNVAERQLAQARADNLSDWWAMATDAEPRRLLTWREYLEQEVAERRECEARLANCADRLMRWAAQGGSEEDVPDEVFRAIQIMRGNEYESDDEADDEADDAEMADDAAELGEDRHGGGMARLTREIERLREVLAEARRTNTDLEQRLAIADRVRVERQSFRADREHDLARGGASLLQWARGHFELLPMEIAIAGWVMQQPAGTFAFVDMEVVAATVP
jgi:hypothetical protein